jgi:psp operon transcriptional activator
MPSQSNRPSDDSLGRSEVFLEFQQRLSAAAKVDRPILLIGERGTGKELAANRLHFLSRRWSEPLVTLNCAALTPSLITSELFGHEAGAFTGADQRREGRFETAHRGTLFLDEIGHIPMEAQEKILRVVEYGSFERVGSSQAIQVDTRIIGATNSDLQILAEQGTFKRDLLDRLSFEVLLVPALRDRGGDVQLLATHFATRMAVELNLDQVPAFSDSAQLALRNYPWPGNIRELKNVVERAVYRAEGESVEEIQFDPFPQLPASTAAPMQGSADRDPALLPRVDLSLPLPEAIRRLELSMVDLALRRAHHHQGRAAKLLGLSYHQFRGMYRKHKASLAHEPAKDS